MPVDREHRNKCREATKKAIAQGVIQRPTSCQRCGSADILNVHHTDYDSPLDVMWLCSYCHEWQHYPTKRGIIDDLQSDIVRLACLRGYISFQAKDHHEAWVARCGKGVHSHRQEVINGMVRMITKDLIGDLSLALSRGMGGEESTAGRSTSTPISRAKAAIDLIERLRPGPKGRPKKPKP